MPPEIQTQWEIDVERLRVRLRGMADEQLLHFEKAARYMVSSYANSGKPPLEAFVPTRLEWLALDLESRFKSQLEGNGIASFNFTASGPDTILVSIVLYKRCSAALVDKVVEMAKDFVNADASSYGWSKWVKIRVERSHLPSFD